MAVAGEARPTAAEHDQRGWSRRIDLGLVVGLTASLGGFLLGTRPLRDNSFFTHLATGRLILDTGSVPSTDPYSFTAAGEPWVVQSWLASVVYALVEDVGGAGGIRLLIGGLFAALVACTWRLARPSTTIIPRLALVALVIGVGGSQWSERPLMFGLLLLVGALLVVEEGWSPWWLVPAGWAWANVHGSFPLGVLALVVLAAGTRLDGRPASHELRCAGALIGGCLLGAVGPLGLQALLFPLDLVGQQDVLQNVTEWRAPTFDTPSQRIFLVQVVLAVAALVRRPSWRHGLVMALFVPLALLSARNIAVTSLLLVPVMAAAAPPLGRLRAGQPLRPPLGVAAVALLLAMVPLLGSARLRAADFDVEDLYPTSALEWLDDEGIDPTAVRTAAPDFVGNLFTLRYGPEQAVFFDDRFDMYPPELFEEHLTLISGEEGWQEVLDRWEIDLVVVQVDAPWGQLVSVDPQWRVLYGDDLWLTACRRGSDLGSSTC